MKFERDISRDLAEASLGMSTPSRRQTFLKVFAGLWVIVWLLVLIFPNFIVAIYRELGVNVLSSLPILGIFFASVLAAEAYFRQISCIKFENASSNSEFGESFANSESSTRRTRFLLVAVLFGLLHIIALVGTCLYLNYANLYLFP